MNVARAIADRLVDQQVDELDNRRVFNNFVQARKCSFVSVVALIERELCHSIDFSVNAIVVIDQFTDL